MQVEKKTELTQLYKTIEKMNIFDQMLSRYEVQTNDDYINAQHEVMQQIALAGLYRGGFFQ